MTNPSDLRDLIGRTAVDSSGDKIGKVGQIYLDDNTGEPVWVTIQTGLFGNKETFAPLAGSRVNDDDLVIAAPKDVVKDAPSIDADEHTSDEENDALYDYYRDYLGTGTGTGTGPTADVAGTDDTDARYATADAGRDTGRGEGRDVSGPNTDDAMTRSEEQLNVGTRTTETGRARLRKYVVTENVTQTVPVSHEEVRVEREPITDANRDAAVSGADITEEEHEVTLHAERPVVEKETVPVERVRLGTETVTEDQQVNETVRKEQIEEEGTTENAGGRSDV
jgi:uncharacterized protein (TIGR02271 family)